MTPVHTPRTCEVEGCDRPYRCKGMCERHYRNARYKPRPLPHKPKVQPTPLSVSDPKAFVRSMVKADEQGCWLWQGHINPQTGYGTREVRGKAWRAHRFSYVHFVGEIPDGLVLDHLCRVRHCVNPDHLEPVTPQENVARGLAGLGLHVPNVMRGCGRHGFSDGRVYEWHTKKGKRRRQWQCRVCMREVDAKRSERRRRERAAKRAVRPAA